MTNSFKQTSEGKQRMYFKQCLSCGTTENMKKQKYCSIECRQQLRQKLNQSIGLLKTLNTRYAAFYFTDTLIIMDLLPYGETGISSFIHSRTKKRKPADDLSTLTKILGNEWWAEHRRTNKKYIASRHILSQSEQNSVSVNRIKPIELRIPALKGASITNLRLNDNDLDTPECIGIIKKAYRRQAMQHHPDHGGTARDFRKIRKAYEELLDWAKAPTFINRRGFPDKWFYDGNRNRWVQPIPAGRSGNDGQSC